MIVSASYKTDIPAFYGEWFIRRLRRGRCRMRNPRSGRISEVRLDREATDGFVFWTRNAGPFLPQLDEVARRGYPFVVHYTITGYPRPLERSVPEAAPMVRLVRRLAGDYGPHAVVWRYDPILLSSLTPRAFHLDNFAAIAGALAGATTEVVVSHTHLYRKTRRNLDAAAARHNFVWSDPTPPVKRRLTRDLAAIAGACGMRLSVCSQPEFVSGPVRAARCIDGARLGRVAGAALAAREKGNRPGCACHEARDIGDYDSCPHGCVYCYAVERRDRARMRHRSHDPAAPLLLAPQASGRALREP